MALKKCKECGNEVSSSAKVCPKCGKKLKMGMMKKILIGIGVLILIGAIGSQRDKESEGTANNSVESTPSKKINKAEVVAGAIGEPIEIGHFVYQVDTPKFRKSVGNEYTQETADGVFLVVPIAIKNIGDKSRTLDGSMFKLVDANGTEYSHSSSGSTALMMSGAKTIFLKQCQPNITTAGMLIFEVPDKTSKYTLQVSGGFWTGKTAAIALN